MEGALGGAGRMWDQWMQAPVERDCAAVHEAARAELEAAEEEDDEDLEAFLAYGLCGSARATAWKR